MALRPCTLIFAVALCLGTSATLLPAQTKLALPSEKTAEHAPEFSEVQLAYVQSWIKDKVRDCPASVLAPAATKFLEELQRSHPGAIAQLQTPDFPTRDYESMLLRNIGAQLGAPAQATLRE